MPRPPSPGRSLLRLLDEADTPFYALSGERRIVFASRSLGEWVGVEAEKLAGLKCDYRSGGDGPLGEVAAALCPPPEALTGECERGWVSRPARGASGPLAPRAEAVQEASSPAMPRLAERDDHKSRLAERDDHKSHERRPARFIRLGRGKSETGLLLVVVQPADADSPALHLAAGLDPQRLHGLLAELRGKLGRRFHISQLVGQSDAICRVREQVRVAAEARTRVLVVGPPGSGREHVARTIHYGQPAASIGPLFPVACPLVDAEQMQAALAAVLRRQHDAPSERPPAALLLEVDRLRPDAQQELAGFFLLPNVALHTLATARTSLRRLAAKGKFRSDLAYALSTLTIALPPLKSRPEDVPLLAQHFLEEANALRDAQLSGFQPAAMELLVSLPWPGNVEQLAQAVREACQRASGRQVLLADLPDWVQLAHDAAAHPPRDDEAIRLDDFLAEIERELLQRALRKARGNKSKAAQLLGINRTRLLRRLSQLGLAPPVAEEAAAEEPVIFEPLEPLEES